MRSRSYFLTEQLISCSVYLLTSQFSLEEVDEQSNMPASQPAINTTSQPDDKKTSQTRSRLQDSKLTPQQVEQPASTRTEDSTSYQVEKLLSPLSCQNSLT